jgi:hypothetical protein
MECPSLSRLINVGLKSALSEISIATPACFRGPLKARFLTTQEVEIMAQGQPNQKI